jgi:solute carrier family 44 protein 1 (choline transporter-like protein)
MGNLKICLSLGLGTLNLTVFKLLICRYNFCKAAQKAFSLLTSNILIVAAINSVGTFILFLGKVSVVVSTVFIGIEIMKTQEEPVKYVWAPITLAALFSYMIVDCFIGVYGVSIQGDRPVNICACQTTFLITFNIC